MGREVKRVPLNFDLPVGEIWSGYEGENRIDPPKGDAYQVWETVTEGSPISPPFATPEELAQWLVDNNASASGSTIATYETWLAFITGPGWAPSFVISNGKLMTGIEHAAKTQGGDT